MRIEPTPEHEKDSLEKHVGKGAVKYKLTHANEPDKSYYHKSRHHLMKAGIERAYKAKTEALKKKIK